jgi:hypothetical protein
LKLLRKFKSDEIDDWLAYQDWVFAQRRKEDKQVYQGRADHLDQWIKLQAIKFAQRQREDANALKRSLQLLADIKYGKISNRNACQDNMEDDSLMLESQFLQKIRNGSQTGASENSTIAFDKKAAKKVQIKDNPIPSINLQPINAETPKVPQGILKRKTDQDSNIANIEKKDAKNLSSPQCEGGVSSFKKPTKADYRALIASSQIGGTPNKTSWWKKIFKVKSFGTKDNRDRTGYQKVLTNFSSIRIRISKHELMYCNCSVHHFLIELRYLEYGDVKSFRIQVKVVCYDNLTF